ncbi:MAG: helix-turn-helix transcriptional regulator [Saprospiraceae bacterium]|nr:helix-turn-helix transcriptional regulator [Saprospiraceae bacterium]
MCNIVTERFIKCHDALKASQIIKSSRQFAISIDYLPQSLNEILKGNRDVSVELLQKAIEVYQINSEFLFKGKGSMFSEDTGSSPSFVSEIPVKSEDKIIYVPIAAQAGYAEQFNDNIFTSDLDVFTIPDSRYKRGNFRCFDVAGDSMEPSLFSGDKVICGLTEINSNFTNIRNNFVYVVVLDDSILVKRVINNIKSDGTLQLISDNNYYTPISIPVSDVKELWQVELRISNFMPSHHHNQKALHEELTELRKTVGNQSFAIQSMNQTIEKLLKSNRAQLVV